MKTEVFERFLDTKYGQCILEKFNKEKRFIENPADLIVNEFKNKIKIVDHLDIGGGTGIRTEKIVKGLKIENTDFLEPSKKAPLKFLRKSKKSGMKVNLITCRFEDFQTEKKYDFITSVHAWYYIELDALRKLHDLLRPRGFAVIFMDSENDTIKKIQDICETEFWKGKTLNAEDICKFLDKIGVGYEIRKDERKFKGLIKSGNFTERAKIIMSLVSYARWEDIQDSIKLSVKRMLEKISKNDIYPSKRWLIIIRK